MDLLAEEYFEESMRFAVELYPVYEASWVQVRDAGTLQQLASNRLHSPTLITGQGNYYFTSILNLEFFYQQLDYLIALQKLPPHFSTITSAVKSRIIPYIALVAGGPSCVYVSMFDHSSCPNSIAHSMEGMFS